MQMRMLGSRKTQVRLLRFLCVGGSSALVQLGTLWIFRHFLSTDIAFSASFVCSTATHYCLNRFWALPSDRHDSWLQFAEYLGTALLSYGVNLGLFKICHDWLALNPFLSAMLVIPPSTVLVFLLLNFRVFRKKESSS